MFKQQPATASPYRNRSHSPINTMQRSLTPMKSPMRGSDMMSSTMYCMGTVDTFVHLEPHGITLEGFKTEKSINYELTKMARSFSEIARMYKNAITLLRKDSPSNTNLAAQIQSRVESHKTEASECKRKLWETHGITV